MSTETILIAEDETVAHLSLTELLGSQGFRVIATDNGNEALSSLLHEEPDAALLDVRVPGLDGLSVLRRARESGLDTALIVMTAHGDSVGLSRAALTVLPNASPFAARFR